MWAFGVTDAGCYGAIDVKTGSTYLFVPRYPDEYAVWMGPLLQTNDYSEKYGISNVYYVDELKTILQKLNRNTILTLKGASLSLFKNRVIMYLYLWFLGLNTDSGLTAKPASFDGIDKFSVDSETLFPIIANLRVYKTELELTVLRYVIAVSSAAHCQVKPIYCGLSIFTTLIT